LAAAGIDASKRGREEAPFFICTYETWACKLTCRTDSCSIIEVSPMVRDGYLYGGTFIVAGLVLGWLTRPVWAVFPFLLALFFLWFFRDPEREIPQQPGAVVSPADGKVTDVSPVTVGGEKRSRISIFLSVFDVHVNRSPIAGTIQNVRYQRGKFLDARNKLSAEQNEQNVVTVAGEEQAVIFKQIAGLLARRIVFHPRVGDGVARGERVGLIKFGSRVDVVLDANATLTVKVGDRVQGGASILAYLMPAGELTAAGGASASGRAH
jgi:phosphatidylserine decarboxylase